MPATPVALPLVKPASYQPCQGTVQPVAAGGVWMMTGSGLLVSSDGGATWSDATPTGVNLGVFGTLPIFCALDGSDAWLAAVTATDQYGEPAQVGVWQTSDGGRSWTRSATVPDPSEAIPMAIQFVDADHGWLLMGLIGMARSALLFGTDDGGATWIQLAGTWAGTLDFVSATQGWLAFPGGAAGDEGVYATTDGGKTWTLTSATFLAPVGGEYMTLDGFRFLSLSLGIAATNSGEWGAVGEFEVWMTSDGGASWQEVGSWPASTTTSVSCAFDVISAAVWVVLDCNSTDSSVTALDWTVDGGADWTTLPAMGLPDDDSYATFAFLDSHDGFELPPFGPPASLYATTDSGESWQGVPRS
jgi:photosystem II stability/assembly factor-like uncharacterized protein